jgi:hypothetical protein
LAVRLNLPALKAVGHLSAFLGVVLYEGISIHGRVVCTEPKEWEADPNPPETQTRQPYRRPQPR